MSHQIGSLEWSDDADDDDDDDYVQLELMKSPRFTISTWTLTCLARCATVVVIERVANCVEAIIMMLGSEKIKVFSF